MNCTRWQCLGVDSVHNIDGGQNKREGKKNENENHKEGY